MGQRIDLGDDVKRQATHNLVWKIIEGTFGNAESAQKRKLSLKMIRWDQRRLQGLKQEIDAGHVEQARNFILGWL